MMTEIVLPGLSKYIGEVEQREAEAQEQRDRERSERQEQSEQTHQQRVADSEYLKIGNQNVRSPGKAQNYK